jgi:light-regulated signal transduction histidine kinase (bacteriophytochrome)
VVADDGRPLGAVLSLRDVSGQRALEAERERLIAALERSNRELDQFAYVTSHDLKAPLRGIANLSQWMEEDLADKLDAEGREQMTLLRGRVARLDALIDGILSYARAGRAPERRELVDMDELLQDVVELLSPAPEARIEIAPALPRLHADRVALQQVFLNLIGNAIKHARRADVTVTVTCLDRDDGYEFAVSDNGPGISRQYHERIWQIFQTLEARDKVEGTGIGLSIVKKIVESHGGRVAVESSEGAGATFRVWLPSTADS